MINKINSLLDSLAWAVPFSVVGAVFGDAIRKDALSPRQRVAVGMLCFVVGPLSGAAANREFGLGEFTSYVIASFAPTVAYDFIGMVVALLRAAKDDPRGAFGALRDLFPWGRK
jgi:hypothetical protein